LIGGNKLSLGFQPLTPPQTLHKEMRSVFPYDIS